MATYKVTSNELKEVKEALQQANPLYVGSGTDGNYKWTTDYIASINQNTEVIEKIIRIVVDHYIYVDENGNQNQLPENIKEWPEDIKPEKIADLIISNGDSSATINDLVEKGEAATQEKERLEAIIEQIISAIKEIIKDEKTNQSDKNKIDNFEITAEDVTKLISGGQIGIDMDGDNKNDNIKDIINTLKSKVDQSINLDGYQEFLDLTGIDANSIFQYIAAGDLIAGQCGVRLEATEKAIKQRQQNLSVYDNPTYTNDEYVMYVSTQIVPSDNQFIVGMLKNGKIMDMPYRYAQSASPKLGIDGTRIAGNTYRIHPNDIYIRVVLKNNEE